MTGYETCLVIHHDTNEEEVDLQLDKLRQIIASHNGDVIKIENWGKKRLQYPIKKQQKGYYCFVIYSGSTEILHEIDRFVRYNDTVLRSQTVRIKDINAVKAAEMVLESKETLQEIDSIDQGIPKSVQQKELD